MFKFIRSYKFAAYLLASLLLATVSVAISILYDIDFHQNWILIAILIILITSISSSLAFRIRGEIKYIKKFRSGELSFGLQRRYSNAFSVDETIKLAFEKRKWRRTELDDRIQISESRGSLGIWSSFVFHLGMIIVSISIIIRVLFGFYGMFALTVGESIDPSSYQFKLEKTGPFFSQSNLDSFELKLIDYSQNYDLEGIQVPAATLTLTSVSDSSEHLVYKNNVMLFNGFTLNNGEKWGSV